MISEGRSLRISLAVGTLELGGTETQVVGMARELKAAGHDVEVIVLSARGPLAPRLDQFGIPIRAFGYTGIQFRNAQRHLRPWRAAADVLRLLTVVRHLRRRRTDVLHAYLFWSYALLVPLAWVAGVPVRIAARRGLHKSLPAYPLLRPLTSISTALATAVVANAEAVARDAEVHERVPREKLHVIRNAVDLPEWQADPTVEPPVGLMVANLIHYKGHLDLIEALARLEDPPVIRCIGEGPMRPEIEAAISRHGLQEVMLLEGRQPRARDLYADVQFAVLASHSEGMPNAVLEAMAAGLPVVATDVGGCRELIEHELTGLLVPPSDQVAMAAALQRVAHDTAFRATTGVEARRRAKRYGWQECAAAHIACYRELLPPSR